MEITQVLLIGGAILGGLLTITLGVLFFVSRKSQKVMESLLMIMTRPERAKVADAVRVLNTMLADEINKIEQSFQTMRDTLNAQIATADELKKILTEQNEKLVSNADEATKKIATMSGRLDNTVTGLGQIVESQSWTDVENATDRFMTSVNGLLGRIDQTALDPDAARLIDLRLQTGQTQQIGNCRILLIISLQIQILPKGHLQIGAEKLPGLILAQ